MDFNADYSKVIVVGTIDSDIVLHKTKDGVFVSNFTVAIRTKQHTHQYDVAVFGDIGEQVAKVLDKGCRVLLEGHLSTNTDGQIKILAVKVFPMELPF